MKELRDRGLIRQRFDYSRGAAALTLSAALTGLFAGATDFEIARLRARERCNLQLGLTAWRAEGLYIEPSVAFGLNGPADSVVFGRTIPYAFVP